VTRHERLLVGRDAACDLRFDDDTVSRRHAAIQATTDGRLRLIDLASSNGTWLRGTGGWRRLVDEAVEPGATIRFGEREVVLRDALGALALPAVFVTRGGPLSAGDGTARSEPPLERPRRNPETGEIEEGS
jgi:pSer/pThr/pTyr-binding forkhead associated (FHA) protein